MAQEVPLFITVQFQGYGSQHPYCSFVLLYVFHLSFNQHYNRRASYLLQPYMKYMSNLQTKGQIRIDRKFKVYDAVICYSPQ